MYSHLHDTQRNKISAMTTIQKMKCLFVLEPRWTKYPMSRAIALQVIYFFSIQLKTKP